MATGTVVNGKIVVSGTSLEEGTQVTIFVPETADATGFRLGKQDEAALLEAIQEADAGELIDGESVLRELGCRV